MIWVFDLRIWIWAFGCGCGCGLRLRLVELVVMGFLCIRLDFLVKVVVLVEGFWWIYIFDSFGFFGGVCDCIEGC